MAPLALPGGGEIERGVGGQTSRSLVVSFQRSGKEGSKGGTQNQREQFFTKAFDIRTLRSAGSYPDVFAFSQTMDFPFHGTSGVSFVVKQTPQKRNKETFMKKQLLSGSLHPAL